MKSPSKICPIPRLHPWYHGYTQIQSTSRPLKGLGAPASFPKGSPKQGIKTCKMAFWSKWCKNDGMICSFWYLVALVRSCWWVLKNSCPVSCPVDQCVQYFVQQISTLITKLFDIAPTNKRNYSSRLRDSAKSISNRSKLYLQSMRFFSTKTTLLLLSHLPHPTISIILATIPCVVWKVNRCLYPLSSSIIH